MTEVLLWLETHQMPRHQGEADQVASRGQEEEEEEEEVVVVEHRHPAAAGRPGESDK